MFVNTMPRYEILSADAIKVLDRGWRRIVSEIGIQFAKPEAVELFRKAGQQVDDDVVRLDIVERAAHVVLAPLAPVGELLGRLLDGGGVDGDVHLLSAPSFLSLPAQRGNQPSMPANDAYALDALFERDEGGRVDRTASYAVC